MGFALEFFRRSKPIYDIVFVIITLRAIPPFSDQVCEFLKRSRWISQIPERRAFRRIQPRPFSIPVAARCIVLHRSDARRGAGRGIQEWTSEIGCQSCRLGGDSEPEVAFGNARS